MIILEGPDGSGKTTLAKEISLRLKLPIIHSGGKPKDEYEAWSRHKETLRSIHERRIVIMDRVICISDYVYGRVLRGGSSMGPGHHQELAEVMRLPIIYCRPPDQDILELPEDHEVKGHETSDHVARVQSHQPQIVAEYDQLMSSLLCRNRWQYNYRNPETGLFFAWLQRRIELIQARRL